MANSEIGTAYVALMPSMDKFNSAIRKALKDLGVSKADLKAAGESAGEEIGKGAAKGVKDQLSKAGDEAAKEFSKSFASGSKKYMSQVSDIQKFIQQTKERISFSNLVDSTASKKYQDTAANYVARIKQTIAAENKELAISSMQQIAGTLGGAISNVADTLGSKFLSIGKTAGRYFVDGASAVISGFKSLGEKAGAYIVSGIRTAYSKVGNLLQNVAGSQIRNATHALGLNMGSGIVGGLTASKVAIGSAIGGLISTAVGSVTSSISSAISRSDTMANFPKVMANMGIGAEDSSKAIKELSTAIDGLPTTLNDAALGTQRLVAKNSDIQKSTKYFTALNNAIIAGGASTELQASAVEQLTQSYSKGQMDMMEWRTLQMAMPAQLNQIAKAMNMTTEQLGAGLRRNDKDENYIRDIGMDEFMDTLVKLNEEGVDSFASFADQARTSTNTIGVAITNVQNRINKAMSSIIDWIGQGNIADTINAVSSKFGPVAENFVGWLDKINAKQNIVNIAERFGTAIGDLVDKAKPLKNTLQPIVDNALPSALGVIDKTIGTISGRVEPMVQRIQTTITELQGMGGQIQPVIDAFVNAKFDTWDAMLGMWSSIIQSVTPVLPKIIDATAKVNTTVAETVSGIVSDLAPRASQIYSDVAQLISEAGPFVREVISTLAPAFTTISGNIMSVIRQIIHAGDGDDTYFSSIGTNLDETMQNVGKAVNDIVGLILPHLPHLMEVINGITADLGPVITDICKTLDPYIDPLMDLMAKAAHELAPAIRDSIDTLDQNGVFDSLIGFIDKAIEFASDKNNGLPKMAQTVSDIFNAFGSFDDTDGEETPIERIYNAIQPHIGDIMDMCSSIADKLAPALGDMATDLEPMIDPAIDLITKAGGFIADHLEGFLIFVGGVKAIKTVGSVALGLFGSNGLIPAINTVVSTLTAEGGLLSLITGGMASAGSAIGTAASGAMAFLTSPAGIVAGLLLAVAAATWFFTCTDTGKELWGNFTDWLSEKVTNIKDWFKGLGDSLKKAFRGALDWVKEKWDNVVGSMNNSENWATPVPSTQPFANGGIVYGPTNALLGEAGYPEAVVPLTAQGIDKFTSGLSQDVSGQVAPNITVHIDSFINQDTGTDIRTLSDEIGRQTLRQMKQQGVY